MLHIITPESKGVAIEFTNPLLAFKFDKIPPGFLYPHVDWPRTLRHPTSLRPDATTDETNLKKYVFVGAECGHDLC